MVFGIKIDRNQFFLCEPSFQFSVFFSPSKKKFIIIYSKLDKPVRKKKTLKYVNKMLFYCIHNIGYCVNTFVFFSVFLIKKKKRVRNQYVIWSNQYTSINKNASINNYAASLV